LFGFVNLTAIGGTIRHRQAVSMAKLDFSELRNRRGKIPAVDEFVGLLETGGLRCHIAMS
jgi:hypothetical protein